MNTIKYENTHKH